MTDGLFDVPQPTGGGGTLAGAVGDSAPLAVRMRPRTLEELAGQEQLRAEMGLVAERLEQLEQAQSRLETGAREALLELGQRPSPSRAPLWIAIIAIVVALGAMAVALMSPPG